MNARLYLALLVMPGGELVAAAQPDAANAEADRVTRLINSAEVICRMLVVALEDSPSTELAAIADAAAAFNVASARLLERAAQATAGLTVAKGARPS